MCLILYDTTEIYLRVKTLRGFPGSTAGKESACSAGDLGSIPGWEDPLKNDIATHSSILDWRIPMDRGAWWATIHGIAESDTTERLSTAHIYIFHPYPFSSLIVWTYIRIYIYTQTDKYHICLYTYTYSYMICIYVYMYILLN